MNEIWVRFEFNIRIHEMVKYGKICQNMVKYGRIWQDTVEYGRIRQNTLEYGRICGKYDQNINGI